METRKLYYEDCHLRSFSAHVTGCSPAEEGWEITLDATAFYPEGGGQACDLGCLGGRQVMDVQERGEAVVHLCDGPLAVGEAVTGEIDWKRRFDLMQQHSGEHIISGLICARFGYHNVGFHMGSDVVTIDFDGPIPPEALGEIEAEANRILWQDLPISCTVPAEDALEQIPYRSKRRLAYPVRIVEVPGCDVCACCGVHVARTGEIGLVKLFSMVKFHQGVRIEMACGGRALSYLSAVFEQNRQVSQAFSAKLLETGAAARKMNGQLAAEKFRAAGLQKQIFRTVAQGYTGRGDVVHFEEALPSAQVRELADAIARTCGGAAAVFSGGDGAGYGYCLMAPGGDLRQFGRAMAAALNGRGGGKPEAQQGTVNASQAEIQDYFSKEWHYEA